MITTPSMGLKRWNDPNDIFSYTELSDNFALLDAHDHTTGKGVQIPTAGIANLAVTDTQIASNAITAGKIASDAVTTAKILNANVTDAKLVSPNNSFWRTIWDGGAVALGLTAGTWLFSPTTIVPTGVGIGVNPPTILPWTATDYNVAGKTASLRVLASIYTNATAPAINITAAMYPVTAVAGAANVVSFTVGAAIGIGATFTTPAANSRLSAVTGAITSVPDGFYALGFSSSGSQAANSAIAMRVFLQVHHV